MDCSGSPATVLVSLSTVRRERLICSRVVLIKYARREVCPAGGAAICAIDWGRASVWRTLRWRKAHVGV
jgi:hypothetical protein